MSRWVVGGLVAFALVLGGCVPLAPSTPGKTVVVYGDSLMTEAYPVAAADLAKNGWQVVIRQFPGSPLCYWQAQMAADKAKLHPQLVILAFYGNFGNAQASQACTQGRGDLTSVYTQDAAQAATTWAGTATLWVSAPASVGSTSENPVTPIFRNQAASSGESFVDAGATLRAADGSWPRTLPCLASETPGRGCGTDGQITVRSPAPDTVHMCPVIYNPFVGCLSGSLRLRHPALDRRDPGRRAAVDDDLAATRTRRLADDQGRARISSLRAPHTDHDVSMEHRSTLELTDGLDDVLRSPSDDGLIRLIVRRPAELEREVLTEATLDRTEGLVGDTWRTRGSRMTPDQSSHPDMQLTVMNARAAALIAVDDDRWQLAGDQLFVDLDLSEANLPPGTQLTVGSAVIEVTDQPHLGCAKFRERFGEDALRFVNSTIGRQLRLRGVNTRVVRSGRVVVGDPIRKRVTDPTSNVRGHHS